MKHLIVKDEERYPSIGKGLPDAILVYGSKEEAEEVAERLSNYYAGCDGLFLLEDPGITVCFICGEPLIKGQTRKIFVQKGQYQYGCTLCITREQDHEMTYEGG